MAIIFGHETIDGHAAGARGSDGAGYRWQFAWAKVLLDTSAGRVSDAVERQATLTEPEQRHVLLELGRLDEFINFAYRALKSHRDGRTREARLDSAESVGPLLDIVFGLEGRVRPYNKYLAWELSGHPLSNDDWQAGPLLGWVEGLLDGSASAMREVFRAVERACRRFDSDCGGNSLSEIVDGWGPDLVLLRGEPAAHMPSADRSGRE